MTKASNTATNVWQRRAYLAAAGVCLVLAVTYGALERPTGAATFFAVAVVLLVFGNLHQFEQLKISLSGLEAKTREAATVAAEAKATLQQLSQVASLFAQTTLSLMHMSGRSGGFKDEELEGTKRRLVDLLLQLEVPEDSRSALEALHHEFIRADYVCRILDVGIWPLGPEKSAERTALVDEARERTVAPEELAAFLDAIGLLGHKQPQIEDYRYYLKHRVHRKPHE